MADMNGSGMSSPQKVEFLTYSMEQVQENLLDIVSQLPRAVQLPNGLEIAIFALDTIIPLKPVDELEDIFEIVCPVLQDACFSTIEGITQMEDSLTQTQMNSNETISLLLNTCNVVAQAFQTTCDYFIHTICEIAFESVRTFVDTVCKVILKAFSCNEKQLAAMSSFVDEISLLKEKWLQLISHHISYTSHDTAFGKLPEMVQNMTSCALHCHELKIGNDKYMTDVWRAIVFFIVKFEDLRQEFDGSDCIAKLCNTLVEDCLQDSALEKSDITLRALKLHHFYLKLIVRLCKMFTDLSQECWESLVRLLLNLSLRTPSQLFVSGCSEEVTEEITKNLIVGANPLLAAIFDHPKFQHSIQHGSEFRQYDSPYACLILLIRIMKKLNVSTARRAYFSEDFNIFGMIFDHFRKCDNGINGFHFAPGTISTFTKRTSLYEFILVNAAAFVISLNTEEFVLAEKTLLKYVLQTNTWTAMLACDILVVVARYADQSLCHALLETLMTVLRHFESTTSRPEFVHVSWLMRRLAPLCDPFFLTKLRKQGKTCENLKMWGVVGFESQNEDELLNLLKNRGVSDEIQILAYEALACRPKNAPTCPALLSIVADAWRLDSFPSSAHRLLSAMSALTISVLPRLPADVLLSVLESASFIIERSTSPSLQLPILALVENIAELSLPHSLDSRYLFSLMANIFKVALTSESPPIRAAAWQCFAKFAAITPHTEVLMLVAPKNSHLHSLFVSYLQKELPEKLHARFVEYDHYCHKAIEVFDDVEVSAKRLKVDSQDDFSPNEVESILLRFEQDGQKLQDSWVELGVLQKKRLVGLCERTLSFSREDKNLNEIM